MKRLLFTLFALLLSAVMMAGNFVMVSYSGRAELERIFNDPNLTVHYYTDSEVYATAERFDQQTMVMLDENAFAGVLPESAAEAVQCTVCDEVLCYRERNG